MFKLVPLTLTFILSTSIFPTAEATPPFRPPAVPLVTHDPYFSIWSAADHLHDRNTTHWTGASHSLGSLVRIDGRTFRLMGQHPSDLPTLQQVSVKTLPTRTIYQFKNEKVALTLTFTTPALPNDLDLISRPVTYVTFDVVSADDAGHDVQVYLDASAEITVNERSQSVTWGRVDSRDTTGVRLSSEDQKVLASKGDDLRIEWGHLYVAAAKSDEAQLLCGTRLLCMEEWSQLGKLPTKDDQRMPRAANDSSPVGAIAFNFGKVRKDTSSRTLMLAYDDEYSLTLMGRKLRPYWRRDGLDAPALLDLAAREFPEIRKRCIAFDEELMSDLRKTGGEDFATLGALAHRQALAANKIVADAKGAPLMFSKENFSNGCIGTVDVLYPAAPQLLLFSPTLAKASLVPILAYAASPRWKFPFAPHDIGTYPRADGQVYGGGERTEDNQMPVEESGNMLILLGAIARIDGSAKFSEPYWPQISAWAKYLEAKGFDPENQLCTDDFAGHLAHNVNLSAKAIEALGAYAYLCDLRGEKTEATRINGIARDMAARWVKEGTDGDHTRLAFDKPGTWSQKYNLVWDRVLGLKLFPEEVLRKEVAYYHTKLNRFGLPLDSRKGYTKLDWTVWTGTLTGERSDLEKLVAPTIRYLNETSQRNPMTDWHETTEARQSGFQARSVVGGVFIPLLGNEGLWKKWASRDRAPKDILWAPLPTPPAVTVFVPTSEKDAVTWRYTFDKPEGTWFSPEFSDESWKIGPGGFGTQMTPSSVVRTEWQTQDIWIRRFFNLPESDTSKLSLRVYHDEDAEIYINGVLAAKLQGFNGSYDTVSLRPAARTALKPGGQNTFAVHCRQTRGGQFIDVGLVQVEE